MIAGPALYLYVRRHRRKVAEREERNKKQRAYRARLKEEEDHDEPDA